MNLTSVIPQLVQLLYKNDALKVNFQKTKSQIKKNTCHFRKMKYNEPVLKFTSSSMKYICGFGGRDLVCIKSRLESDVDLFD